VTAGADGLVARGIGLDDLTPELQLADVLFAATGAPGVVVTEDMVRPGLRGRDAELLVVDIAVPRDVDHAVAALDGVELLDMDAVTAFTDAGLAERRREVSAVREIVDAELARFAAVTNAREVAPVVTALRERAESVRSAEVTRAAGRLAGLTDEQRDAVDALTRGVVSKLLHDPTVRLKDAAGSSRGDRLADSLRDLFDLSDLADATDASEPTDQP